MAAPRCGVSGHGRIFTHNGAPLPAGLHLGRPGKCFENAQLAARSHGLGYAEGFAGPTRAGRWTLHAWNTDRRGLAVDPTWGDRPGKHGHYFGIAFDRLPEGEDVGISVLADKLGGKLVIYDRAAGRVEMADGDSELARMVKEQGGVVFQ
jgi:hypothetical protein